MKKIVFILVTLGVLFLMVFALINRRWEGVDSGDQKPFLEFTSGACQENEEVDPYEMENQIVSQEWEGSRLNVKVKVSANCCTDKKGDFLLERHQLTLSLEESGKVCYCQCAYDLIYSLGLLEKRDYWVDFKVEE